VLTDLLLWQQQQAQQATAFVAAPVATMASSYRSGPAPDTSKYYALHPKS